jgi:glucose uptake protein
MILPQTYSAALFLMILCMLCWGSWANTYKLAGKWRFEMFYFDFAFGLLLAAFLYAFTFGNLGYDGFSFVDDLMHAGKRQWLYGFAAGVIFNFANMLLVAAISVAGMAVAFPIGMGVALIIGVTLSNMIRPTGNFTLLFAGCALIVAAIVVDAIAYRQLGVLRHEQLARAGQTKSTRHPTSLKGIILALVSGLLMGSFFPLLDMGRQGEVGLGPYAIGAIFAMGVFFSTFVFNIFFMNLPVEGDPVEFTAYFKGRPKQHLLGFLGGAIWATGGIASFVAASASDQVQVGPAISYAMAQGATLISALWGLLAWKEFKGSDTRIGSLVALMLVLFACGLALVSIAPLYVRRG